MYFIRNDIVSTKKIKKKPLCIHSWLLLGNGQQRAGELEQLGVVLSGLGHVDVELTESHGAVGEGDGGEVVLHGLGRVVLGEGQALVDVVHDAVEGVVATLHERLLRLRLEAGRSLRRHHVRHRLARRRLLLHGVQRVRHRLAPVLCLPPDKLPAEHLVVGRVAEGTDAAGGGGGEEGSGDDGQREVDGGPHPFSVAVGGKECI